MQTTLGSSMKNVILYHLQNGHVKKDVSLERQMTLISVADYFQSLGDPFFNVKGIGLTKLMVFTGAYGD